MADSDPIQTLATPGDLRVWSVIITFFGDSVRPEGCWAPATALAQVSEPLGVGPAALRTALHRLARDGWVQRERRGRQAFYALSPRGLREFAPATQRIYATAPALSPPWRLAFAPPGLGGEARAELEAEMIRAGWHAVGDAHWLGHGASAPAPGSVVSISGTFAPLPDWLRSVFGPPQLAAEYARLEVTLGALDLTLAADPRMAAALRTLLIHQWRRLLLRHPDLPEAFFPDGWAGERCRGLVLRIHAALSPAADQWVAAALAGADQAVAK